jgi:predicted MFS family arabinose efflux permease
MARHHRLRHGALSKPLFALAPTAGMVLRARVADRIGKGVWGAPRDALVADITPPHLRGAAYGLRQSLDTVGAFLGPLLAVVLMLLWADNFRLVFWVAVIPGLIAVALLMFGIKEPVHHTTGKRVNPLKLDNLKKLTPNTGGWRSSSQCSRLHDLARPFLSCERCKAASRWRWFPSSRWR